MQINIQLSHGVVHRGHADKDLASYRFTKKFLIYHQETQRNVEYSKAVAAMYVSLGWLTPESRLD